MRRSPADSTNRSLAAFGKLQHILLERSLELIRFAAAPWTPANRVRNYNAFSVSVYGATLRVLRECGGYIDRNEFDFFLSRIRNEDEIPWAVQGIGTYRELEPGERDSLHEEVAIRGLRPHVPECRRDRHDPGPDLWLREGLARRFVDWHIWGP